MKATKKQLEFISVMEDIIGIKFVGSTKEDAQKYISKNMNAYKLHVNEWATVNGYD